jgi:hypothetical protein
MNQLSSAEIITLCCDIFFLSFVLFIVFTSNSTLKAFLMRVALFGGNFWTPLSLSMVRLFPFLSQKKKKEFLMIFLDLLGFCVARTESVEEDLKVSLFPFVSIFFLSKGNPLFQIISISRDFQTELQLIMYSIDDR